MSASARPRTTDQIPAVKHQCLGQPGQPADSDRRFGQGVVEGTGPGIGAAGDQMPRRSWGRPGGLEVEGAERSR